MADYTEQEPVTLSTQPSNVRYRPIAEHEFRVYKWRWYMVLVVCLISMANALIWICFSPITSMTTEYYGVGAWQVNWLSLIYVVVSVPFGFAASWLIDTLGLRTSIILSAWLNVIGSMLRNLTTMDNVIPNNDRFPVLMTGQFLAAVAQPFVMFCPTKLAALWFSDTQRALANTVTSMANPLGILVANLMSPRLVTKASEMPVMLWACTGVAGVGCVLATFGVCSSTPPSPPTSSAAASSEAFLTGLKKIIRIKTYWVLLIVFGTGLAIFTSVTTFIQQILCPRGYSNEFSGLCGALMIGLGIVGAAVAGVVCDRTKRFEEITKISFALTITFGILFLEVARFRDMELYVGVVISLVGLFGFAIYPICMELAVEITYPVAEATSSGLLIISGQVQSIIFMLVAQELLQPLPASEADLPTGCVTNGTHVTAQFTPQDWTVSCLFLFGLGAIASVVFSVFFRPMYRRLRAEDIARAESLLNYEVIISPT